MLIVDSHLDLSLNALQGNRDLLSSAYTIRAQEQSTSGKGRAQGTVAFPEMRRGRIALSFATVLARSTGHPEPHMDFPTPAQAHGIAKGQLAYYHALERQGHVRLIRNTAQLDAHMAEWAAWDARYPGEESGAPPPLGFVISMESADPVLEPAELRDWWEGGLRLIGPAHFGPGRYAGGTGSELGLTELGAPLLSEMARVGIILDLTHCSDQAFWEALARYDGPVHASHNNCRALNPHQRQLSDKQIRAITERDGVIGVVPGCWQLKPGWRNGDSNESVSLADIVAHMDHICQIAGASRHVGIGSDLDGGVGREGFAHDLDTIADLQKVGTLLAQRGYHHGDVAAIMHGNWTSFLKRAWGAA
ncbi:MAG TPA: membrane dipeptidase [bacterium]|nr:membrane dipeptidase [bacterium]